MASVCKACNVPLVLKTVIFWITFWITRYLVSFYFHEKSRCGRQSKADICFSEIQFPWFGESQQVPPRQSIQQQSSSKT